MIVIKLKGDRLVASFCSFDLLVDVTHSLAWAFEGSSFISLCDIVARSLYPGMINDQSVVANFEEKIIFLNSSTSFSLFEKATILKK